MEYFRRAVIPSTSGALILKGEPPTTEDEFMRYISIWFAMTFLSVETRKDYWATESDDFIPAPDFGRKFSFTRGRFSALTECLRFVAMIPAHDPLGAVRD
jgi:hypothetical protein